jgi:DNA (cytosine-5)-methyltransferase 1
MKVIDLFAGCGGLSLGFQNAGFDVVVAFDNWQPAIDIYKENFHHPIISLDLADLQDFSIFDSYFPDLIIGGPPCQDFSSAGKREENHRADLTVKFAEIIAGVKPKYFVMENVERVNLTKAFQKAINIFQKNEYGLSSMVLNASFCGVPQARKRFFLIGVLGEKDAAVEPYLRKNLAKTQMSIFDYLGNSLGIEHYYRHPRSYARRAIFSIYEPSPTIRGVNRPIPQTYQFHEGDTTKDLTNVRPLTTLERSYLQTFPLDFKWGKITKSNLEQAIGNAVPVKLAEFVAKALKMYVEGTASNIAYETQQLTIVF